MLIGGTNSGANLAMAKVAAEKKKVFISIGAGSARLTNEECTPYTVHYAYDTIALARGTGGAIVKQGGKNWYFMTADYAFGQSLEKDTSDVVKTGGGKVLGAVKHPLSASDFSSFLLQAQSSGADPGPGQCRRRRHQLDQGRQRVRHHQENEAGRFAHVH
jgi:branched-chain amino acid transport system substrate-binding protein